MTVQGDFPDRARADAARAELIENGIEENHIRVWNILPESSPRREGGLTPASGGLLGGVLAGGAGFVVGAALGAALSDDSDTPLPSPSGVRVVVDAKGNAAQIKTLLHASGAARVHTNSQSG